MIIHGLLNGHARCGLPGRPPEWPEGHDWVSVFDEHSPAINNVTCQDCLAVMRLEREAKARKELKDLEEALEDLEDSKAEMVQDIDGAKRLIRRMEEGV